MGPSRSDADCGTAALDGDDGLGPGDAAGNAGELARVPEGLKVETRPTVVVPTAQPRRPVTVYECDGCGTRELEIQRCEKCGTFMRRVGLGGLSPCCGEAVAVDEPS